MSAVAGPGPTTPARARPAPDSVVPLLRELLADLDRLTDVLVDAILQEDPSYSVAGRATPQDLRTSCRTNLQHVLTALLGEDGTTQEETLAPPRATGTRRAQQGVPLESVLHAYRLGFRTIWEALVAQARSSGTGLDALVDAATQVWEVVDLFSSTVADAYRSTEQSLAQRDDRRREALLDALLEGRAREPAVAAEAGVHLELPERALYCVVVVDGTEHGLEARRALGRAGLRAVWRTRAADEVGLVLLVHDAGPGDVVAALDVPEPVRAAVSPAVDGLASVDAAHRAALMALRTLGPDEQAVVELDTRLPAALLVSAPELAERLVRRSLGGVLEVAGDERDLLLETLRTWLATDGSAGRTAALLYCHRNTVLNRLRRLEALTGRSAERFDDLVAWSLALQALDLLPPPGTSAATRPLS